jgi:hypothetical protein
MAQLSAGLFPLDAPGSGDTTALSLSVALGGTALAFRVTGSFSSFRMSQADFAASKPITRTPRTWTMQTNARE